MDKKIIYVLAFLLKGWEVSLLLLLPFIQKQFQINIFDVGILGMCLSAFYVLAALFSGHLSEKIGDKGVIALAVLSYGGAWIGISFGSYFPILILVYSLAGIGSGIFLPIANSIIAQISKSQRGKELGDFSAVTDLGRVAFSSSTALMFSLLGLYNLSLSFGAIILIFLIILGLSHLTKRSKGKEEKLEKIKFREILKNKRYLLSIATGMVDSFSSSSLYIFIPFLLLPKGIGIASIGYLTALFFLGYFFGRVALGRLSDKHGAPIILIASEIIMAILIVMLVFVSNFTSVSVILFSLGIFTRGTSPIIRAMVGDSVEKKVAFNKAYSFYSFSVNSSSIISRPLFGFIAGIFGISAVFYFAAVVSLLIIIPISLYSKIGKY